MYFRPKRNCLKDILRPPFLSWFLHFANATSRHQGECKYEFDPGEGKMQVAELTGVSRTEGLCDDFAIFAKFRKFGRVHYGLVWAEAPT